MIAGGGRAPIGAVADVSRRGRVKQRCPLAAWRPDEGLAGKRTKRAARSSCDTHAFLGDWGGSAVDVRLGQAEGAQNWDSELEGPAGEPSEPPNSR